MKKIPATMKMPIAIHFQPWSAEGRGLWLFDDLMSFKLRLIPIDVKRFYGITGAFRCSLRILIDVNYLSLS